MAASSKSGPGEKQCEMEKRIVRLEKALITSERRIEALEASARVQRKVCDLLVVDLAHDDRAVFAIKRVQQLFQRTFPEQCNSGIVWLGNNSCDLASLPPDIVMTILSYLKCKFGRTAMNMIAPAFWMPQPNLKSAVSLSSFVHGYGEAVITLTGHVGTYAKFMGMYELDIRHIVHGYPVYKKIGMHNPHFIYKCSLNGKWLVTDEPEHCPKNLSRIGSKFASEVPNEVGMKFEIWKDGTWVVDPFLRIIEGKFTNFPQVITLEGHTGPQKRFMGTYEVEPIRIVHGFPLYKRRDAKKIKGGREVNRRFSAATNDDSRVSNNRHSDGGGDGGDGGGGGGSNTLDTSGERVFDRVDHENIIMSVIGNGRRTAAEERVNRSATTQSNMSSGEMPTRQVSKKDRNTKLGKQDFIYKCSINGKWLVTDDADHFPMNLSRIGTENAVEFITDLSATFEVWRGGTWHRDPKLRVVIGDDMCLERGDGH